VCHQVVDASLVAARGNNIVAQPQLQLVTLGTTASKRDRNPNVKWTEEIVSRRRAPYSAACCLVVPAPPRANLTRTPRRWELSSSEASLAMPSERFPVFLEITDGFHAFLKSTGLFVESRRAISDGIRVAGPFQTRAFLSSIWLPDCHQSDDWHQGRGRFALEYSMDKQT